MATEYVLTYKNIRAWGEPSRYILAVGGANWKDNRFPFVPPTELPPGGSCIPADVKARLPYGAVPLLEFDGKSLVQSMAIARFLANKFNLAGKDEFEAAKADEIVDACGDLTELFLPYFYETDPVKKSEGFKKGAEQARVKFLNPFEKYIQANGGGHLVGSSLTWADIVATCYIEMMMFVTEINFVEGFSGLENLIKTVNGSPGIKEYVAQRPETVC